MYFRLALLIALCIIKQTYGMPQPPNYQPPPAYTSINQQQLRVIPIFIDQSFFIPTITFSTTELDWLFHPKKHAVPLTYFCTDLTNQTTDIHKALHAYHKKNWDNNSTGLVFAAFKNYFAIVYGLIALGYDVNQSWSSYKHSSHIAQEKKQFCTHSPITEAIQHNHLEIALLLLCAGADPLHYKKLDGSLLMNCLTQSNEMKLLLDYWISQTTGANTHEYWKSFCKTIITYPNTIPYTVATLCKQIQPGQVPAASASTTNTPQPTQQKPSVYRRDPYTPSGIINLEKISK